jgi:hypothetical protein
LHFGNLFALLVGGELASESAGELGPQEEGALGGAPVKAAGGGLSLLLIKNGKVAGDVPANALDLGKLGGTARGGLGISEISEFLLKAVNVAADGLDITLANLFVDLLFDHSIQ